MDKQQNPSLAFESSPLVSLVSSCNVELSQNGENWKGPCPFHPDVSQSLIVKPDQNHWACPVCDIGGSDVDWVMKCEGISKSHAQALLKQGYQGKSINTTDLVKTSSVRHFNTPFDSEHTDQQITQHVVNYYHEILKQSPKVLDYLFKEGVNVSDAMEYFRLGVSDRSLGYYLPEKNRKEGAALRGCLQRIKLIKANGHETFRGCIVVPIIENGVIQQLYGRKITAKLRPGTPRECFLPETPQALLNGKALQTCEELIVCGSIFDALTFWCAGYKNVTCTYGLSELNESLLKYFQDSIVKRVLIAYAHDTTSNQSATSLATQLQALGMECYRVEFPKDLDANKYIKQNHTAHDLGELIRKSAWMGNGQAPSRQTSPDTDNNDEINEITQADTQRVNDTGTQTDLTTEGDATLESDAASHETITEPDVLPATIMPSLPAELGAEISDEGIVFTLEDRRYRIRGLHKNVSTDTLKVNLIVSRQEVLYIDTLDLYSARARKRFVEPAAIELSIDESLLKKELGQITFKLDSLQQQFLQEMPAASSVAHVMTAKEEFEAMALLQSPDIIRQIRLDYEYCGMVGETTNILVSHLAALSRNLDKPLAIIIQSTSAAGKSALMDAVLAFVPEEERVQYSAITGQSLFYLNERSMQHKILGISEETGFRASSFSLKLLQSEGRLTIASTGKDPDTGRHVTREYHVEGPVMIFSTTTAIDIDEELLNRCLALTVDESREQTRAIHDQQRLAETLEGQQCSQQRETIIRKHRNAQRLLKSIKVVNPYAPYLTFLDDKTRTRRDHQKYLTLIRSITLLHQYQREEKTAFKQGKAFSYIEVTLSDIELANELAHEVLGHSLDELPPQTRHLLFLIEDMVSQQCQAQHVDQSNMRFTRRDVRDYTGWGDTQLKVHIKRLETLEYLLIHRGGRGKRMIYELLYQREGQDGKAFMMGLVDTDTIQKRMRDVKKSDQHDNLSGASRAVVGPKSGYSNEDESAVKSRPDKTSVGMSHSTSRKHRHKGLGRNLPPILGVASHHNRGTSSQENSL